MDKFLAKDKQRSSEIQVDFALCDLDCGECGGNLETENFVSK